MKIKLLILFSFFITICNAQLQEIYNKSEWITRAGKWYEVQTVVYSDSSIVSRETPLGDTATVVARIIGTGIQITREMSDVIAKAAQTGKTQQSLVALDSAMLRVVGKLYRDTIRNLEGLTTFRDSLGSFQTIFQIDSTYLGDSTVASPITRTAQGTLRINFGRNPTNYSVTVWGDRWIRINNFPAAGRNTEFFQDYDTGYWYSTTRHTNNRPWRMRPKKDFIKKPAAN